jgi:hypothetical protein
MGFLCSLKSVFAQPFCPFHSSIPIQMSDLGMSTTSDVTKCKECDVLASQNNTINKTADEQTLKTQKDALPNQQINDLGTCCCCEYYGIPCRQISTSESETTKQKNQILFSGIKRQWSPQEQLIAYALSDNELPSYPKRKHHKDAQPQEETHECYIDGWTITCTQFQPRRRIRSKKQKGKYGKSQEITSRKACYQCGLLGHYFRNCPEKSSLQITSEMKLSQSPDMEYEQKCTETSTNNVKTTPPCNSSSRACFGCGDTGHLVNGCPKKDVEINKVQKKRQHPQTQASTKNKQRKETTGKISYAVTGTIPYDDAVIFGTLVIHTTIATVLYDPCTTHSLISAQFATKYGIFKCPLRSSKTISAPEGKMLVNYICPKVSVKINGIDFPADLLVIESMEKDVILGRNWLQRTKAVIQHTERTMCLETPSGERIVVEDNRPPALKIGASD